MLVLRVLVSAVLICAAAPATRAATITIRGVGSSALGTNTVLDAGVGSSVALEIVLDTQGLTLEGYSYGLDLTGGSVSSLSLAHATLPGLAADVLLGPAILDQSAGTVRNVNQADLSPGAGLAAGVYVLDTLSFTITATDAGTLTVSGGLFGEVFGLGQGSCPGTVPGCGVQFFTLQIVPEPGSAGLLAAGLAALAAGRAAPLRRRSALDGRPKAGWRPRP